MSASRYISTGFLLLALLLQTFSRMVVIVDFYANQDNISKELCVNRNSPAIHCCGKCQLRKRMKAENKDNGDPERKSDNKNEVISSRSFYLTTFDPLFLPAARRYPPACQAGPTDQPADHFHPPGWLPLSTIV